MRNFSIVDDNYFGKLYGSCSTHARFQTRLVELRLRHFARLRQAKISIVRRLKEACYIVESIVFRWRNQILTEAHF